MNNEIVVFGHHDLDQLGCMLNIEIALPDIPKTFFHTNYKDIVEISHEVEDYIKSHSVKLLMITDVSFADNKQLLVSLIRCANDLNLKVIYLDHHVYPEGFFDEFKMSHVHDITKSATQITYEFFDNSKHNNDNLNALTYLIDTFDIWQMQRLDFKVASNLNDYFMDYIRRDGKSIGYLFDVISQNGYNLPNDYDDSINDFNTKSELAVQKARDKGLIHCDGFTTIAFVDEYFNDILYEEFSQKKIEVVLIANSYGIIRVRFNSLGNLKKETKEKIKFDLGCDDTGHLNAFPILIKNPNFNKIIQEIKQISSIINKHKG
jgi:hypothetical protein